MRRLPNLQCLQHTGRTQKQHDLASEKEREKNNPLIIHWIDICDRFDVSMYSFDRARGKAVKPWDKSTAQTDAFMWAADSCIFMRPAQHGRLPRMRIYLSIFVSHW